MLPKNKKGDARMFFKKNHAPAATTTENEETGPLAELRARINAAELPPPAAEVTRKEFEKLEKTDPSVAEYAVGLNYLDFLLSLPWSESTRDNLDLPRAESIFDARHFGLARVKERILEFLAAKTLCGTARQSALIVDDEEIARTNMMHVLSKDGHHCKTASNGLEALDILAKEDFDVVVTDLKMDKMDGLELLSRIRRTAPDTEVIMVTGFATVSTAVEALKKGAAHYLGKPVNLDELRRTVREVLDKRRATAMGKGPILCFTGPPGTGKTSVGRAVAESLQRRFVRISLAGLRDEAELRGHRRTYVGAMPGRILMELKRTGVNNPVFMLDEIDKVGQDFRGDPASVFLEVLDPEQNVRFMDHYLDIPFDLSRIMFIATANDVSRLPGPLLDRMELIEFPGYAEKEKLVIAERFLVPRQLKAAGLSPAEAKISPEAILRIINDYTRESGLRSLDREVAGVCRKLALLRLTSNDDKTAEIDAESVARLLGPKKFHREAAEGEDRVGVTTGLVWSEAGGEIITVETATMKGAGRLILTGSLGEVLRESAQAALSYIRSHAGEFGVDADFFESSDIHIHFPAGAISKDGPSAGATIFIALLSLLTGRPARRDAALTGEMTLSGRILPVSGIREKLLAARRAGVKTVVLPKANEAEIESFASDVVEGLRIVLAGDAREIIDQILLP